MTGIKIVQCPETKARYIYFVNDPNKERTGSVARTICLRDLIDYEEGPELMVDVGHDGELLGIEIL